MIRKLIRRLYYETVLGPRGYGRPVPKDIWDEQYQRGDWNYLFSLDELGHYMLIVGYIYAMHRTPAVLDVGCGSGRLLELLSHVECPRYLGLDISAEAVKKARSLCIPKANFEVASYEQWQSEDRFDVIVFNESLQYASNPVETLNRYNGMLEPQGFFVVSICNYGHHGAIWRNIEKHFAIAHTTRVENTRDQIWDVGVILPSAA